MGFPYNHHHLKVTNLREKGRLQFDQMPPRSTGTLKSITSWVKRREYIYIYISGAKKTLWPTRNNLYQNSNKILRPFFLVRFLFAKKTTEFPPNETHPTWWWWCRGPWCWWNAGPPAKSANDEFDPTRLGTPKWIHPFKKRWKNPGPPSIRKISWVYLGQNIGLNYRNS